MTRVRVQTPSRLHFGLIAPGPGPGRRFGGAGLMIEQPGITLTIEPADTVTVTGKPAYRQRVLQCIDNIRRRCERHVVRPLHVCVESAPPEHVGLGTGTQLALGVALGVTQAYGMAVEDVSHLANLVGRFPRSGIGMHGFFNGGFIVDAGKQNASEVASLEGRHPFPENWRIVLIRPETGSGVSGDRESEAFARLARDERAEEERRRLLREVVVPALTAEDFDAFAEALHRFNRLAGDAFASVQAYANPAVAHIITQLRSQGIKGVGQSSWGPTFFALARDEGEADGMVRAIARRFPTAQVSVTKANNLGVRTTVA